MQWEKEANLKIPQKLEKCYLILSFWLIETSKQNSTDFEIHSGWTMCNIMH